MPNEIRPLILNTDDVVTNTEYNVNYTRNIRTGGTGGSLIVSNPLTRIADPFEVDVFDDDERALEEIRLISEHARELFDMVDPEDALSYLSFHLGISKNEAMGIMEGWGDKQPTLPQKIRRYLRGEQVEDINEDVVKQYFDEEKRKRFITKDERGLLHKPVSDGELLTSSVKLDDLVPN